MGGPLIHIGYHKTGTSWLQRCLFSNAAAGFAWAGKKQGGPVDRLSATHALDFRAPDFAADFAAIFAKAEGRGLTPVVSHERLSGHPFSGGHDSKEMAQRLAELFPDGRILIVIREQRAIITSTYKQYVKAGGAVSPGVFLDPPRHRNPRVPQFDFRHFQYHRLIELHRRLFGEDRVLVLAHEQFRSDPIAFVTQIAAFAGAGSPSDALAGLPFGERLNQAAPAASVAVQRLVNRLVFRTDVNPTPMLPWSGALEFRDRLAAFTGRIAPRAFSDFMERRLRQGIVELAAGRFAESNAITGRLTGLDLAGYGYETARA